jgi:hypothetical protein
MASLIKPPVAKPAKKEMARDMKEGMKMGMEDKKKMEKLSDRGKKK